MTAWRASRLRHWRPRWGGKIPWLSLKILVTLIYLFIFTPILVTGAVSFNERNRSQFPPEGFSLVWWQEAFSAEWVDPLLFSLRLAVLTGVIACILGTPLAFAFVRYRFRGREALLITGIATPVDLDGDGCNETCAKPCEDVECPIPCGDKPCHVIKLVGAPGREGWLEPPVS